MTNSFATPRCENRLTDQASSQALRLASKLWDLRFGQKGCPQFFGCNVCFCHLILSPLAASSIAPSLDMGACSMRSRHFDPQNSQKSCHCVLWCSRCTCHLTALPLAASSIGSSLAAVHVMDLATDMEIRLYSRTGQTGSSSRLGCAICICHLHCCHVLLVTSSASLDGLQVAQKCKRTFVMH